MPVNRAGAERRTIVTQRQHSRRETGAGNPDPGKSIFDLGHIRVRQHQRDSQIVLSDRNAGASRLMRDQLIALCPLKLHQRGRTPEAARRPCHRRRFPVAMKINSSGV